MANIDNSLIFGTQFLEPVSSTETPPLDDWKWKPVQNADMDYIASCSSWPSTTGTGPGAGGDERQEEM